MYKVYLEPEQVWGFYHTEHITDSVSVVLAENKTAGFSVEMTDDMGLPRIRVFDSEGDLLIAEDAMSNLDAIETVRMLYEAYIYPDFSEADPDIPPESDISDDITPEEFEDLMYEREDDLRLASTDYLEVLLEKSDYRGNIKDIEEEFTEHACNILATKFGICIYRPTIVEYQDGTEDVELYPYLTPQKTDERS